jgi:hypothetical protein
LVVKDGPEWRSLGTNEDWAGNYVRTFAERTNGDLLITTFDGLVWTRPDPNSEAFGATRLWPVPEVF